jgi:cell division control protein 6
MEEEWSPEEFLSRPASIITNRAVLSETYLPNRLPHREGQAREIGGYLSEALRGSTPPHLLLEGPAGSGKTAVIKWLIENLKRTADPTRVVTAYAVVSRHSYRNLTALASSIGCRIPRRGMDFGDAWEWFSGHVGQRVLIAVLDEVDKSLALEPESELLYYLTSRENTCVVLISNKGGLLEMIKDLRIKSRLSGPRFIHFPPYTAPELADILADRAKKGLAPNAISDQGLNLCAAIAVQEARGDARYAIQLLATAAELAGSKGKSRIDPEDITEANHKVKVNRVIAPLTELDPAQQLMLYTISKNEGRTEREIFTEAVRYMKLVGMAYSLRHLRTTFYELEERGLIRTDVRGRGRGKGVAWLVTLSPELPSEIVAKRLGMILGLEREA